MKILNDIFVLHNLLADEKNTSFNKINYNLIQLIQLSQIGDFEKEYKNISQQLPDTFCISFDAEPNEENLLWLIRFIMLPSYHKTANGIKIFAEKKFHELIKKALSEQGFFETEVIDFNSLEKLMLGNFHGFILSDEHTTYYDIIITNIEQQEIHSEHTAFAKSFLTDENSTYKKIKNNILENAALKKEIVELNTELQNQKKYLQIALKQKEAENILNFYHSQYEVLPLWYKKFGHLIKIITGKRKIK